MTREEKWILKEKYGGEKSEGFFTDCERLRSGEPLAYIIGSIPFLNTTISLDTRPLIPRTETEYWVEIAIKEIKKCTAGQASPAPPQVLDLCAGSGCIGVAIAQAIPEAHITFSEIDSVHLPTITKNLKANRIIYDTISSHHTLIQSDLFEAVPKTTLFDFILTNPPYVDPQAQTAERSVTSHEPHLALFGGNKGLEFIVRIIKEAPQYLASNGQLWIEHEPAQADTITKTAFEYGLVATVHNDQYNTPRYSILSMAQ